MVYLFVSCWHFVHFICVDMFCSHLVNILLLIESPLFSFSCISNCMIKSWDVNLVVMTDLLMYYSPMVCTANVHYQHVLIDFKGMKPVTWKTDITCDTVILIHFGASQNDIFEFPLPDENIFRLSDSPAIIMCDVLFEIPYIMLCSWLSTHHSYLLYTTLWRGIEKLTSNRPTCVVWYI